MSIPLAVKMVHSGGCGVTLTLITPPPEAREPNRSSAMRDAVLGAILTGKEVQRANGGGRIAARAVGLRAVPSEAELLSPGETQLMGEWLDRMVDGERDAARKKAPRRGRGR